MFPTSTGTSCIGKLLGALQVSVQCKTQVTNVAELVYSWHALKDEPADQAIEGLSRSADHYEEATGCLKRCCDRPRLIHPAHVCAILGDPSLKEANGKDLHCLHDGANQHLQALGATNPGITESSIAALLEFKSHQATIFELQSRSQDLTMFHIMVFGCNWSSNKGTSICKIWSRVRPQTTNTHAETSVRVSHDPPTRENFPFVLNNQV